MASHKTLFMMCASLSLQAMEQKSTPDTNALIIPEIQQYNKINDIYNAAYKILDAYNPKETESIVALSTIINKTHELKSYNIKEEQIGKFAYQQETSLKNKFLSLKPPYNNPFYVSVLFERIRGYNAQLQKNEFTTPTLQQFQLYLENKDTQTATEDAAQFNVFLEKEKLLHNIPFTVATQEFETLLQNIAHMQTIEPDKVQKIAQRIYQFKKSH